MPLVLPSQSPCSFCENFQGRDPWHGPPAVIFQDELIYVFVAPAAGGGMEGHTLVTTKGHQETILDLTREQESLLGQMIARAARMIHSAVDPDGILIQQHNGEAAFQSVPHIHFHVIPMREGATSPPSEAVDITPAGERAALAERLREHWDRV